MATQTPMRRSHQTVEPRCPGRAQLTLVEHALCPLDTSLSLEKNFVHQTTFQFTDRHRNRRRGQARIGGLDGMSAHDEFYLWGLLAIALSQSPPKPDLLATPYYCLRQLGMISNRKRGGREFDLFRAAIKRLAGMKYENDAFYDPIRGEHRAVSFGLLNYSLPLDLGSSRAWRFAWDPIFFELAQATGGALSFDLALYRRFDAATRRLYLYLKKVFWRQDHTGRLDLHRLAVNVLGFAPTLETSHLRRKVTRCIEQLLDLQLLQLPLGCEAVAQLFSKRSPGVYSLQLHRGEAFNASPNDSSLSLVESPLVEPLRSIGFDPATIRRIIRQYPASVIEQWADITLAARERHGDAFFTRSPQAYFVDNVKEAAAKQRTPPDWWRELRKEELKREREQQRSKSKLFPDRDPDRGFEDYLKTEAREAFRQITRNLIADLQRAGQHEPQARENAESMARTHLWHRYVREHPEARQADGFQRVGASL